MKYYYFQDNLRDTTKIPDITVQSPTPEKVILKPVQSPSLPTPFGSVKQEETGKFLRPRLTPVEEPSTQISSVDTRKDEKFEYLVFNIKGKFYIYRIFLTFKELLLA